MLTNAAVKAARPRARAYKLTDGHGLHLFVTPAGTRSWRWRYRYDGREKLLSLGCWPAVTLIDARAQRDEARARLKEGIDPASRRTAIHDARTFEDLAREWHAHMRDQWTMRHAADVITSLERDLFPHVGKMGISAISPSILLVTLRQIEARGSIETARRIRQRASAVFSFGIAQDLIDNDPAAIVAKALRPAKPVRRQPALLELDDARALLDATTRAGGLPIVRQASCFLALTAVRMGALIGARWNEFEELDLAGDFIGPRRPVWRVPAARMKLAKAKKSDEIYDHIVPLSATAVQLLRAVAETARENGYDTRSGLVFPINVGAIGALYDRAGFRGRHVPHGWRATFSTILNERLPEERATIDRALGHALKDKVEAAYNRASLIDRRRRIYEIWGRMLTGNA